MQQSSEQGCWAATLGLAAYYRFGWLTCFLVNPIYPNYGVVSDHVIHPGQALYLYHRIASQAPETEKVVLANAYYHLAWMYQDGIGAKRDYEQCVYWYQKSADLGNSVAINNLADKYEHGLGVPLDLDMAIGLYQQVAGRVIAADLSLGRMYVEGRGVEQDFELARKHLNVVLEARIDGIDAMQAEAMQLLASFTEDSPLQQAQHVLKNARDYSIEQISEQIRKIDSFLHMDEAKQLFFKLFLLNAQKGEASSQYQVGYWYLNGFYTEKDLEEAAYWIQKAADQKDSYAECKIGYMYENGLYFNPDLDLAEKWYERSLRIPSTAYYPEYIAGQLNPEYLKMYE